MVLSSRVLTPLGGSLGVLAGTETSTAAATCQAPVAPRGSVSPSRGVRTQGTDRPAPGQSPAHSPATCRPDLLQGPGPVQGPGLLLQSPAVLLLWIQGPALALPSLPSSSRRPL